jgi:hypothetical protein
LYPEAGAASEDRNGVDEETSANGGRRPGGRGLRRERRLPLELHADDRRDHADDRNDQEEDRSGSQEAQAGPPQDGHNRVGLYLDVRRRLTGPDHDFEPDAGARSNDQFGPGLQPGPGHTAAVDHLVASDDDQGDDYHQR